MICIVVDMQTIAHHQTDMKLNAISDALIIFFKLYCLNLKLHIPHWEARKDKLNVQLLSKYQVKV